MRCFYFVNIEPPRVDATRKTRGEHNVGVVRVQRPWQQHMLPGKQEAVMLPRKAVSRQAPCT